MSLILGIDPGFSGALAWYDPAAKSIVDIEDMPVAELNGKKEIDPYKLASLVNTYSAKTDICVIEDVDAMPKQGLSSTFRFGEGKGMCIGSAAAAGLRIVQIKPAVWKMSLGLTGQNKSGSIALCDKLFPNRGHLWPLKKHDGRCEAVLLAVFAAKYL